MIEKKLYFNKCHNLIYPLASILLINHVWRLLSYVPKELIGFELNKYEKISINFEYFTKASH